MSLFFLVITFITFFFAHHCSKKTKPNKDLSFFNSDFEVKSSEHFDFLVKKWISTHKNLKLLSQDQQGYLVHESPSLFSYGYFYHISLDSMAKSKKVNIAVQAKLVSSPYDKKNMTQQMCRNLELKNAS